MASSPRAERHSAPSILTRVTTFFGFTPDPRTTLAHRLKVAVQAFDADEVHHLIDDEHADVDWELLKAAIEMALNIKEPEITQEMINQKIIPTLNSLLREYETAENSQELNLNIVKILFDQYHQSNDNLRAIMLQKLLHERGFDCATLLDVDYDTRIGGAAGNTLELPAQLTLMTQLAVLIYTEIDARRLDTLITLENQVHLADTPPSLAIDPNKLSFLHLLANPPFNARIPENEATFLSSLSVNMELQSVYQQLSGALDLPRGNEDEVPEALFRGPFRTVSAATSASMDSPVAAGRRPLEETRIPPEAPHR